jgi:hypothetical protein
MKCNIDVSFSNGENKTGIGICIRDDDGAFVLAKTEWYAPRCEVRIGGVSPLALFCLFYSWR